MFKKIFTIIALCTFAHAQAQTWQPLSTGTNGLLLTLYPDNSNNYLYAGGQFSSAGSNPANNIAEWNGTSWNALGQGTNAMVKAITRYSSTLYAGGIFTEVEGDPSGAWYIAQWNGSAWSRLPGIYGFNSGVDALTVYNGDLYIAGAFIEYLDYPSFTSTTSRKIAKWNGSSMTPISGFNHYGNSIRALAVYNGELIAAGSFDEANGDPGNNIAKWNGTSWSSLGTGLNGIVTSLAVLNGDLYAGGFFTAAGSATAQGVAKWNGTSWSAVGTKNLVNVYSLSVHNNNLYAGGDFANHGEVCQPYMVAMLFNNDWIKVGDGLNNWCRALASYNGNLVAGGSFASNQDGSTVLNHIGSFNHAAGITNVWYADSDGDGFGTGSPIVACTQPSNSSSNNTDCNDGNISIHPGASEICGNNTDDNCNGQTDEGCCNMTVNAGNDESTFFGYSGDQTVSHTAIVTGGTSPYSFSWTIGRPLLCNSVTSAGDEFFSGGTCSNTMCPVTGSLISNASCSGSATITARLMDTTNVCVTVTDANGCTATDCFTIMAQDARCFAGNSNNSKVNVCHATGSPNNPWVQICISDNAVQAHLSNNHSDYVGICSQTRNAGDGSAPILNGITIYPNPAQDIVHVVFSSTYSESYEILLMDMLGKNISSYRSTSKMGENKIAIPIDNLSKGIYQLSILQGNTLYVKKLVIE